MIIDNPRPEHIPALRRLWQQAFGDPDSFLDSFFATGFAFDRCRCVFREWEPVAAVYLFDGTWQGKKVAYLYALAVDQAHRGQGLSRLLLADTHAALQRSGYAGAILEPATESLRAYYQRLGYCPFGGRQEQTFYPGETPVECRELGSLCYEQKRRSFLPEGGVLQEGALTDFLQTQAVLWGGDGFVAAVSRQSPVVLEFLGDTQKLPGLLRTWQLPQAKVRLVGEEDTAMYLSFSGESEKPTYFGLPMD